MGDSVKNIVVFRTPDNKFNANVNCYKGSSYLTVFTEGNRMPASIWLSAPLQHFICKSLKDILKNHAPNMVNTAVSLRWNRDTKVNEKQAVINVNTDAEGIVYLAANIIVSSMKHQTEEIIGKDIMLPFTYPLGIEISSRTMTPLDKSLDAAHMALEAFENKLKFSEAITAGGIATSGGSGSTDDVDDIQF